MEKMLQLHFVHKNVIGVPITVDTRGFVKNNYFLIEGFFFLIIHLLQRLDASHLFQCEIKLIPQMIIIFL